jgi:hypothetical protein
LTTFLFFLKRWPLGCILYVENMQWLINVQREDDVALCHLWENVWPAQSAQETHEDSHRYHGLYIMAFTLTLYCLLFTGLWITLNITTWPTTASFWLSYFGKNIWIIIVNSFYNRNFLVKQTWFLEWHFWSQNSNFRLSSSYQFTMHGKPGEA